MANNYFGDKGQTIINASFTGKGQVLNLDDENILDPAGSNFVSGDINEAIKSTITGGRDVIGSGVKGTEGTLALGNDTIVGDAVNLNASTFTGGADKITLESMDDAGSTVIGDAISVNGGTTRGGNDTIIVNGAVTGTIIGDVETVTNTTFTAGNDNIQLRGDVTGAEIYTDAKTLTGINTLLGGNDVVTLGVKGKEGDTSVIDSSINLGHGNDNFTAYSTITETPDDPDTVDVDEQGTTEINGEAGNDRFTLTDITGGTVSGGEGNDSFTITDVNGDNVEITGDAGNDSFKITTLNAGAVNGGAGNDILTIADVNDGTVNGGVGADRITITNVDGGTINGGADNDIITISKSMARGAINGDAGNDRISLADVSGGTIHGGADNDTITATKAVGGTFSGDAGNDILTITTLNTSTAETLIIGGEATIDANGKYGADSISVKNALNVKIYGDYDGDIAQDPDLSYNDIIKLTGISTNTTVNGGYGNDSITAATLQTDADNNASSIDGGAGNDIITVTTAKVASIIDGGAGNDSIKVVTATDSSINGGAGNDSINMTTATASTIDGGAEDDSITLKTLQASTVKNGKVTEIVQKSNLYGGAGDDSISITTLNNSNVFGDDAGGLESGNDTLKITTILGESSIDLGAGNDSLFVSSNKSTTLKDAHLADALGAGNDTLQVNWAFNGEFNSPDADNDTLITKGLGTSAVLNFGAGDDNLTITGTAASVKYDFENSTGNVDTDLAKLVNQGGGHNTLSVNWAFNGIFDTSTYADGATLITKGLNAKSELDFGAGNDGLQVIGALSNRQIITHGGDDTVSISSTATNVQIDLGEGADSFSVGSMGKNSTLYYDTEGVDSITIKGTYNAGMIADEVGNITNAHGNYFALSTGSDGGFITLDTLGTGKLEFSLDADSITINKNVAGTAAVKKEISTLWGNDSIDLKGTVTNTIVDAGTGFDSISIGALGTGSMLTYDIDGSDSITIKGTYNAGFVQSILTTDDGSFVAKFDALSLGIYGGSITLDTLGTGKLQFNIGDDTLTINKALSGSLGLKDIFMQSGNDSVTLNTVNGAVISGGADDDYISATGLGTTGVLNGDAGADLIQIGREFTNADSFKATATMNNGVIDGGDDGDIIFIGNALVTGGAIEDVKGTLSGGKVYGGAGEDTIVTSILSGSALMDGGAGDDAFAITNMSGGTIAGGDGGDKIVLKNTFSRGTINGDAGNDSIEINTMTGGTINGGAGQDEIDIENFKGGVINTNDDALADTFEIETMTGGTINSGVGDIINVQNMNGGVINDSADDSGTITIENTMTKGTINGNDGDDAIGVVAMNGGIVNGQDGDDSLVVDTMNGGTVNAGEGDNEITIASALNGGSIIAGKGDDTLILSDGVKLSGKYAINLGAGNNEIQINSSLDGQSLILGATHDNVVLTTDTENANINLGTGNDTINGYINNTSTTDVVIDAGTGNDFMTFNVVNDGSFIYGGAGNDIIEAVSVKDAVIDAGAGNNSVTIANNVNGSIITGNTGHDNILVHGKLINDSFISASSGNDTINVDLWDNTNSDPDTDPVIGGKIYYDNKGQDSITLKTYAEGMVADVKGDVTATDDNPDTVDVDETVYHALSTGTDGGSIQIDKWESGEIIFGNGNDKFVFDFYGDGTNTLNNSLFFGSGTDFININGDFNGHAISYDNKGQDYIKLNDYKVGMVADAQGDVTATDDNPDTVDVDETVYHGLSTGTDGGKIELYKWTSGEITFGNGNDHFILHTGSTVNALDFLKGEDVIDVASLTATITYNNDKLDTIIIESEYTGTGIQTINGTDTINGISTGAGGGYVSVASIKSVAGVDGVTFSNFTDYFNVGVLNIVDDEGKPVVDAPTIELLAGNDNLQVGILTNGSIDVGTGSDAITVNELAGGSIIYDTDGLDSIVIKGVYAGTGIKYYGEDANGHDTLVEGISTGADGGTIIIAEINDEAGVNTLEFSDKADRFEIAVLNVDGLDATDQPVGDDIISLKSGNDSIAIGNIVAGTIDAGLGNDGVFGISQSGDWDKGATFTGGALVGDATTITTNTSFTGGADRFLLDVLSGTAKIYGDAQSVTGSGANADKLTIKGGNDSIVIIGDVTGTDLDNRVTIVGDMESVSDAKTFTAGNDSISFYGNVEYAEIYTDVAPDPTDSSKTAISNVTTINGGNDTLTLRLDTQGGPTTFSNTSIDLGHGNNTLTAYASLNSTSITSGAGVDKINVDTFENGSSLNSGGGNDVITANIVGESSIDTAAGNDKITVESLSGTDTVNHYINAGAGNDTLSITSISGDVAIDAGDGNDHMTIDDIASGTLNGGSDIGNDTFIITTMVGGTVNGGAGNDSFKVNTLANGTVNGDAGNDRFTVDNMSGGILTGDDGNDIISVVTMTGGTIEGGAAIFTPNSRGGVYGTDSITVKNASNATIYGDKETPDNPELPNVSYNDSIKVTGISENTDIYGGYGVDNITITTMNGGTVNGQDDNDTIKVTTMNGGTVDGGTEDDTITITTARDGSVLGGAGNDKITVTTGIGDDVYGGFSIDGGAGNDTITMTTLNRGSIEGGTAVKVVNPDDPTDITWGTDSITVKNVYASSISGDKDGGTGDDANVSYNDIIKVTGVLDSSNINGGHGDDTITVATALNSTIAGGAGYDTITVTNQIKSEVDFVNAGGSDKIFLTGGIGAGAEVNLSGSDGFTINKSYNTKNGVFTDFNMSGGELNGSAGADNIYIATLSGGSINTGTGNDNVYITTMSNGTLNTGAGDDQVVITTHKNGILDGGDGSDTMMLNTTVTKTVSIADIQATNFEFLGYTQMKSGGHIYGTDKDDGIYVNVMLGGKISAGAGADTINVLINDVTSKAVIYGGAGADSFDLFGSGVITLADYEADEALFINGDNVSEAATNAKNAGEVTFTHGDMTVNFVENLSETDTIKSQIRETMSFSNTGDSQLPIYLNGGIGAGGEVVLIDDTHGFSVNTTAGKGVAISSAGKIRGSEAADSFTIASLTGKTFTLPRIDGGVYLEEFTPEQLANLATIDGGAGNDTFTITKASYGLVEGGTGNDSMDIGSATNTFILGGTGEDKINLTSTTASSNVGLDGGDGNDSISIINANNTLIEGGGGEDTITVTGKITYTELHGDVAPDKDGNMPAAEAHVEYADTFTVKTLGTQSVIVGGYGGDSINVENMEAAYIEGGDGDDVIDVTTAKEIKSGDNEIEGGAGHDTITITSFDGGKIYGDNAIEDGNTPDPASSGNDDITVTTMLSGEIYSGLGEDTITIVNKITTDNISIESGNTDDTINTKLYLNNGMGAGAEVHLNANDVGFEIAKNAGNEGIDISGGDIYTSYGEDTIYLNNMTGGSITNDGDVDNLYITSSVEAGEVITLAGVGGFIVSQDGTDGFVMGGGTLTGSVGADDFHVGTMSNGTINGGTGNDHFDILGTMSGGTINGGFGQDVFTLSNAMTGGIIDGGDDVDTVNIAQQITTFTRLDELGVVNMEKYAFNGGMTAAGAIVGTANDEAISFRSGSDVRGKVDAGAGDDTIGVVVSQDTANTILIGGAGDDVFQLWKEDSGGSIIIGDFSGDGSSGDRVYIGSGNGSDVTYDIVDALANGATSFTKDGVTIKFTVSNVENITDEVRTELSFDESNHNTIYVNAGMNVGGRLSLSGDEGFLVSTASGGGFDMLGTNTLSGFFGSSIGTGNGADTVNVNNVMDPDPNSSGRGYGNINTGGGNDELNIHNINGYAYFNTSTGNDTINVTTMQGGVLYGGDGNDSIKVTTYKGGTLKGGAGNDTLTLTFDGDYGPSYPLYSYNLIGGYGADKFDITNSSGTINIQDFDLVEGDTLFVDNVNKTSEIQDAIAQNESSVVIDGVTINFTSFNPDSALSEDALITKDSYKFTNPDSDLAALNLNGGIGAGGVVTLEGGFVVGSGQGHSGSFDIASGGSLIADSTKDVIKLGTINGTLNAGDGQEGVDEYGSSIVDDTIHINIMDGTSQVNAGTGHDFITVDTMNGGTINGDSGNDTIQILTANGGTIAGGAGSDKISVIDTVTGVVNITDIAAAQYDAGGISLLNGISNGGQVNISGQWLRLDSNMMTGGTITGADDDMFITVGSMSGGTITTGNGNTFVDVNYMDAGTINGGTGENMITVNVADAPRDSINIDLGDDTAADTLNFSVETSVQSSNLTINLKNFDKTDGDQIIVTDIYNNDHNITDAVHSAQSFGSYTDVQTGLIIYFME